MWYEYLFYDGDGTSIKYVQLEHYKQYQVRGKGTSTGYSMLLYPVQVTTPILSQSKTTSFDSMYYKTNTKRHVTKNFKNRTRKVLTVVIIQINLPSAPQDVSIYQP